MSSRHPDERLKQAVKALENINKALVRIARSTPDAKQARETATHNATLIEKLLGQPATGERTDR